MPKQFLGVGVLNQCEKLLSYLSPLLLLRQLFLIDLRRSVAHRIVVVGFSREVPLRRVGRQHRLVEGKSVLGAYAAPLRLSRDGSEHSLLVSVIIQLI